MQRFFLGMGVADVAKAAGVEWGKLTDKSVNFDFLFRWLKKYDKSLQKSSFSYFLIYQIIG